MIQRKISVILLLFLIGRITVVAHPHIGVDLVIKPETANGMLEGVDVTWIFDREAFSRQIISDYDPDGNDILDNNEIEQIKIRAFDNIEQYNYFLFLRSGKDTVESPTAENFRAELSMDHITYKFYLPYRQRYEISPTSRLKYFTFTLKDPTGFISVNLSDFNPISLSGNNPSATYSISDRWEQFTFDHGSSYTSEMHVKDILFFPTRS
jgi:ABC-type uncharacterized transport system substrate-binding protein